MIRLFKVLMSDQAGGRVAETLRSGYIGQGPRVAEFEAALQRALDAPRRPLTVNSCTSALDLAMHLCGVGPGTEVVTTPMTCTATNTHVVLRGARPVWADVDPVTGLIDPRDAARKVTRKTRAILAVDWAGVPCDYPALREAAGGVPIIEDAAHAFLAQAGGKPLARLGADYVAWSFQAIKTLTTGDGGALLVPAEQHPRAELLRWYGLDRNQGDSFRCRQNIQEAGYKYHMNDIAATIGLANLEGASKAIAKHRANAEWYGKHLQGIRGVGLPPADAGSSWWLYTLRIEPRPGEPTGPAADSERRDRFIAFLAERGVESSPVHARNDKYRAFTFPIGTLPGLDVFASREAAVPAGWWVTPEERETVARAVRAWAER